MYPKSLHHKFNWRLFVLFVPLLFVSSCSLYSSGNSKESNTSPDITLIENLETGLTPTKIAVPTPSRSQNSISYVNTSPTIDPLPSPTPLSTITFTKTKPFPTAIPTVTLFPSPNSVLVNELAPETFIYLPAKTIYHCKEILARGTALERNPNRFSKVGDSMIDTEQFFTPFDNSDYQLGDYQYLESAIYHYAGAYSRSGMAVRDGLNSTSVMDPMWANKDYCLANEIPLACEIRLNNPSLFLIHFGTNDWTETYERNMRQIIELSISEGIVPVLITKANRVEQTNVRNDILRQLAAEYHIPLWDFDIIAHTLPDRGLAQDDAHLSVANDFDYSTPQNLVQGYKAFNLTGLMFLDTFLREVVYSGK